MLIFVSERVQHLNRRLRVGEFLEATFAQRIERDNRHATFTYLLQLVQHARAVDPHILAEEHHAVRVFEILDFHRADRHSDRLRQSDRRALVAHVRAVGQIVVAVHPRQKLIHV